MSLQAELAYCAAANKLREALDESTALLKVLLDKNNLKDSTLVEFQVEANQRVLKQTEGY